MKVLILIAILSVSVVAQSREVSCTVGAQNEDRTRSVICILPNAPCRPDSVGEVCKATLFNIEKWPEVWKGKSQGSTVFASFEGNRITPVTGSCIERIRKRALELAHLSARQDIDILTPPDCHHLSEERRHVAAKQR